MKLNKKILGTVIVVAGLIGTVLSFQNCAQNSTTPAASTGTDASTTTSGTTGSVTALSYPVSNPVILLPGQSTTIKVTKPSTMGDSSNYVWYVYGDGYSLAAHIGSIVEDSGSLYVSLTLRSDFSGTKDLRVYFYNYSASTYLDGNGIRIRLSSTGSSNSTDAVSELCNLKPDYVPTFNFTYSGAAADALYVWDTGGGVTSMNCSFADSSGNTTATVDCLQTASWPSNWTSLILNLSATNRCGTSTTRTFGR